MNSRFKTIDVLEVAVSAEELIKPKFEEKKLKYETMAKHLMKMHSAYKVRTHAFVIVQLGIIQRDPKKALRSSEKKF